MRPVRRRARGSHRCARRRARARPRPRSPAASGGRRCTGSARGTPPGVRVDDVVRRSDEILERTGRSVYPLRPESAHLGHAGPYLGLPAGHAGERHRRAGRGSGRGRRLRGTEEGEAAHPRGRRYLALELSDSTGRISGACGTTSTCSTRGSAEGDAVHVLGRVEQFRDRLQLEVRALEPAEADPASLAPAIRRDADELEGFVEFLTSEIHDEALRGLVGRVLAEAPLRCYPATPDGHHSYAGGLLEHTGRRRDDLPGGLAAPSAPARGSGPRRGARPRRRAHAGARPAARVPADGRRTAARPRAPRPAHARGRARSGRAAARGRGTPRPPRGPHGGGCRPLPANQLDSAAATNPSTVSPARP